MPKCKHCTYAEKTLNPELIHCRFHNTKQQPSDCCKSFVDNDILTSDDYIEINFFKKDSLKWYTTEQIFAKEMDIDKLQQALKAYPRFKGMYAVVTTTSPPIMIQVEE